VLLLEESLELLQAVSVKVVARARAKDRIFFMLFDLLFRSMRASVPFCPPILPINILN
jgi:hypothetical protein